MSRANKLTEWNGGKSLSDRRFHRGPLPGDAERQYLSALARKREQIQSGNGV